jgi:hypothetical protein
MNSRKSRTKYDKNRLKQYCDENKIELKKDYSEDKINRDTIIEANCLNCSSKTNKRFRLLIRTGCFCKMCMVEKQRFKSRETQLNTGNAKDYLKLILEIIDIYNCTDVSINGKRINEYRNNEIHRDLEIEFTCACGENQRKPVRDFVELKSDADGGKCRNCIVKKQRLKLRETQLNTGNAKDYLKLILEIIERYNCTDVSINGKRINEYRNSEIHRDLEIYFTCTCGENQRKPVRDFVELTAGDADGGKCRNCIVEKQRFKSRETQLNTGNAKDYLKLILEIIERYNCTDVSINGKRINEYRNNEIHRDLEIYFTCTCGENQHKPVRDFVELTAGDADGGKCRNCIAKLQHDKKCTTSLELYGCKYPMQNVEIFEKSQKSAFKRKEYTFPSGRIDLVQGYEPQALDILIQSYEEDDIVTSNHKIESLCGEIKYTFGGKERKYYTDIYIKSSHTFIEIKSDYTFESDKEKNLEKREACINAGINFEFWIMDKKGNILQKY